MIETIAEALVATAGADPAATAALAGLLACAGGAAVRLASKLVGAALLIGAAAVAWQALKAFGLGA